MAQQQEIEALRHLELRLLRCTLPSDHPSQPPPPPLLTLSSPCSILHSLLNAVVSLIESGNYLQALSSSASQSLFANLKFVSPESESASRFYSDSLLECVDSFLNVNGSENLEPESMELKGYKVLLVMAIGVSALLAFIQCNITGPVEKLPWMPLMALSTWEGEIGEGDSVEWEAWAHKELMSAGSELRGKFSNLQYIIFAKTLLTRTKDLLSEGSITSIGGVRSLSWWVARLLFSQQKLLDGRSSFLFDLLQVFMRECLCNFGSLVETKDYWGPNMLDEDALNILSMLHLEMGIMELYYGRVDASRLHFESAAETSKLQFFVSGALGFRTLHQVEPKAQLRLVAGTNSGDSSTSPMHKLNNVDDSLLQQSHETCEESDVLMTPRFVADERNSESHEKEVETHAIAASQLKAVHQAVILAHSLAIEKSARSDELQKWEMAPYIEAIDSQQSSPYALRYFCNLLRIRWESTRSRTKQRALLKMEKLVQGIDDPSPGVAQRVYCCFGVNIPTIPSSRKEFGDLLVSCGLIGEAVKVYEDLELWDNLIYCYQLLDKKAAAIELIKKRLAEKPFDSRLWCSLGDVTNDDACYEKALEVSGSKSSRALRSLARSAYNRNDYEKSRVLWESAMALNSLYPDGWFALGAASLKSREVDKALDAFTRAVQLDPENGEAWNNIACLHMIKKKSKESSIAFKEALKLKRDSWQMWENYSNVAADIGNFTLALEAVKRVLDITKKKRIDTELLERIMMEVERRASTSVSQSPVTVSNSNHADLDNLHANGNCVNESTSVEADSMRTRETEHVIQLLGEILKQIVQGGGAEAWGLYARWHKLRGDLAMCSEALLKQVRSYQGSDLWKDRDRFVKFAYASLELCKVYQELSLRNSSRRELFAAEMHLKNTIKQAESFSDTEVFGLLVGCLEQVQEALGAMSVPCA
ncbi:tetratricopeptide repeat protein 27 homolog [Olea europaea var. sylvestris]|uniref:tetratricopeptide repeat protein 27 homolog n=1 Tax=Olea europaea var. sylvestris TaxID=158386 RepID=UPI000C1D7933|nr:tetratricopeptide repeat protein 27 homolog [Olea europaea var. sylvestris]